MFSNEIIDNVIWFLEEMFITGNKEERTYDLISSSLENNEELKNIIKEDSYSCRFCVNAHECYGHKRRNIGSKYCIGGIHEWMKKEKI